MPFPELYDIGWRGSSVVWVRWQPSNKIHWLCNFPPEQHHVRRLARGAVFGCTVGHDCIWGHDVPVPVTSFRSGGYDFLQGGIETFYLAVCRFPAVHTFSGTQLTRNWYLGRCVGTVELRTGTPTRKLSSRPLSLLVHWEPGRLPSIC